MHSSAVFSTFVIIAASMAPVLAAPAAPSSSSISMASTSPTSSAAIPKSTGSTAFTELPQKVTVNTRTGDKNLIQSLMMAATQKQRAGLLNDAGDFIFDFNNPPKDSITSGKAGHTVRADADTFPAVIGNGVAMTLGFLGPCGINTPHVHNRATEINIVIQGRLVTDFIVENGVQAREGILEKLQATVFPQGAIHTEFNPDCEDAIFVAAFNNVDPGVEQIAQTFASLRGDIFQSTLGGQISGEDIESFRTLLPTNVALGVDSCLKKCGITPKPKRDLL